MIAIDNRYLHHEPNQPINVRFDALQFGTLNLNLNHDFECIFQSIIAGQKPPFSRQAVSAKMEENGKLKCDAVRFPEPYGDQHEYAIDSDSKYNLIKHVPWLPMPAK